MYKVKHMPLDIFLFMVILLVIEVFYFFFDYLFNGIYTHYGYTLDSLGTISYLLVTIFLFAFVLIALYAVTIGFINRHEWARKFTMIFILWAILWTIWGMLIGNQIELHLALFILYVLAEIYLMSQTVKEYFQEAQIFKQGDWTLYKRDVTLKSGKSLTIHFFSKHEPKSGTPTSLPEDYEVGVSDRSKMPFLRKSTTKTIKSTISKKTIIFAEDKKGKKPSNVIYVVNKPQPGQVRGDWAVRGHGKIYSHHRTKLNAIRAARKIAREKEATVMVQKTDGTFSMGFKPKKH